MRKKVIIIDDDEQFARPLIAELESRGFEAEWISESDGAVDKLIEKKSDCLILDVMMPSQHGLIILEQIKSNKKLKGLKVIVASNFDTAEEIVKKQNVPFWPKSNMTLEMMADDIEKTLK